MRRRAMCRQVVIALGTCLLLPLLGLELLFSGPELVSNDGVNSTHLGCSEQQQPTVYYPDDLLDHALDGLQWTRATEQSTAALVFVSDWRQVAWEAVDVACQRVNAVPLELPFLNKGDFAATMGASRARGTASVPKTALLYDEGQCATLWVSPADAIWTVRHTHRRPGEKVFVGTLDQLRRRFRCDKKASVRRHFGFLAQQYVAPPLLLDGRKCEVRVYFAIANMDPWILLYHRGYWRLNKAPYSAERLDNVDSHVGKAEGAPGSAQVSHRWTFEAVNQHLNQQGRPRDWVAATLEPLLQRSLLAVFRAYRPRLSARPGAFLLLGADFLLSDDLAVHFLDLQPSPGLGNPALKAWTGPMVKELLLIQREIQVRQLQRRPLRGLQSPLQWQVLLNEADGRM
eukprot:EG_transcript_12851